MNDIRTLELHVLVQELQFLLGAKIEKIYHPEKMKLIFHVHVPGKGKQFLHVTTPQELYITDKKGETPDIPSGFCTFLRKRLANARIRSIEQVQSERIVLIILTTKDTTYRLYLELFAKGNMLLCDEQDKILSPLQPQSWSDRTLRGGIPYEHPRRELNVFHLSLEELQSMPIEQNLSKTLAVFLGIGGMYAEEICYRAGIDSQAQKLTPAKWKTLHTTLTQFLAEKAQGYIISQGDTVIDIVPYVLHKYEGKDIQTFPTFTEALSSHYSAQLASTSKKKKTNVYEKKLAKMNAILEAQTKQVEKMEVQSQHMQQAGELIYENYQLVKDILEQLHTARKTLTWKDIKEKLHGHTVIKEIHEKKGELIVELSSQQ